MDYDNKRFKVVRNSSNGTVNEDMVFNYKQEGEVLTCCYKGDEIKQGHLIGIVKVSGIIEMSYHQVDKSGILMTGVCSSKPEMMPNGKVRLYESWQWTSGDKSKGTSMLEEI